MSTERVAAFVTGVSFDDMPRKVINQAKIAIRNIICVMVAAHEDRAVKAARKAVMAMGSGNEATLIGIGKKTPCNLATFVNSVMASTLDMDDGSMGLPGHLRVHRGHPGCIVIPCSLAVAERQKSSGKALIESVVVGYEVALATAWLIGQTVLAGRTGTYGAAAAAAKLLGLNNQEVVRTLNIAEAHAPSPTYDFIWTRTDMTKEAQAWGAVTGVTAALLAQAGFSGAPTIYDLPESDKRPIDALGKEWEILGIYFKPYSVCRCSHAAVDGVLEIMKEHNLDAANISRVIVGTSPQKGLNMSNYRPANIWQAQYSIPFTIGAVLCDGEVGPRQITESQLSNKEILYHGDKVKLEGDAEADALLPDMFAARIKIETNDGRSFQTFVRYPRGEPENPLTEEELVEKFRKLTAQAMEPSRQKELQKRLANLEEVEAVAEIVEDLKYLGR